MDPITYIFVAQFLISLMLTAVFLVAWKTIESQPYTLMWALVFLFAVVNGLINVARDLFPSPLIYWVIVCATSLLIQGFTIAGWRRRAGLETMPGWLVGYFIVVEMLVVWFTLVDHHMGLRMMLVPASAAFIMFWAVVLLIRQEQPRTATTLAACVVFACYGLTQAASAIIVLFQGAVADEAIIAIYQQVNLLAQPGFFAGMGLFTTLILADDLARRMQSLAITDPLSGLTNRRGFEEAASRLLSYAKRTETPLSLVIADIDNFKRINDTYGHTVGDKVVQEFSQLLRNSARGEDVTARIGGEEFALLLPGTGAQEAVSGIERMRQGIENATISVGSEDINITASFGIATVEPGTNSLDTTMQAADEALYRAKNSGRNRVELGS